MERWEIEATLGRDRAWLLETYAAMSEDDLARPATESEHDPSSTWSALDHLAHLVLIENNFNAMIRRHVAGDANPVGLRQTDDGRTRSREEIMAGVHAMTESWMQKHHGKPLSAVMALGQHARAETLQLLSELTDEQLAEPLPGAPWADGTIGGVLAANAGHGRQHFAWVKQGWASREPAPPPTGA